MRDLARVAAIVVAALVVGRDFAVAGGSAALVTATIVLVLLMVAALALWRDGFVTASGVGLAMHYVAALVYGDAEVDLAAPVVAALIVLYLDLADLATSLPPDRRVDRALLRASARHAVQVLAVAASAGIGVFAVAAAPWPAAEWLRVAGAAGVAAAVAAPLIIRRRESASLDLSPAAPRPGDDRLRSRSGR